VACDTIEKEHVLQLYVYANYIFIDGTGEASLHLPIRPLPRYTQSELDRLACALRPLGIPVSTLEHVRHDLFTPTS
jgi:hypothetical protein